MWWVRLVLRSNWDNRSPANAADVEAAAQNLEPRPVDQGGLSVFYAADATEGRTVAVLHTVTNNPPKTVDYLLVPDECFREPRLDLVHDKNADQHPYLSDRHFLLLGLSDSRTRLAVAARILQHPSRQLARITKSQIKVEAAALIRTDPTVRDYMRSPGYWEQLD